MFCKSALAFSLTARRGALVNYLKLTALRPLGFFLLPIIMNPSPGFRRARGAPTSLPAFGGALQSMIIRSHAAGGRYFVSVQPLPKARFRKGCPETKSASLMRCLLLDNHCFAEREAPRNCPHNPLNIK